MDSSVHNSSVNIPNSSLIRSLVDSKFENLNNSKSIPGNSQSGNSIDSTKTVYLVTQMATQMIAFLIVQMVSSLAVQLMIQPQASEDYIVYLLQKWVFVYWRNVCKK